MRQNDWYNGAEQTVAESRGPQGKAADGLQFCGLGRGGACADTGRWMRSELNPVEQLKKLEGRIISFHFKDLNKFGGGAHDVPWGTTAPGFGYRRAESSLSPRAPRSLQPRFGHWSDRP
jgi:hypothetical protein